MFAISPHKISVENSDSLRFIHCRFHFDKNILSYQICKKYNNHELLNSYQENLVELLYSTICKHNGNFLTLNCVLWNARLVESYWFQRTSSNAFVLANRAHYFWKKLFMKMLENEVYFTRQSASRSLHQIKIREYIILVVKWEKVLDPHFLKP